MARTSRRGEWGQMREAMTGHFEKTKGVESRENVPDKACGKCKNFSENAFASDGRGFCGLLKTGSDISKKQAYVTEGDAALMTFFNVDASLCKHFTRMEFIDVDASECADPQYRRAQRQMEKAAK